MSPRQLQRALPRFRARVRKERAIHARALRQPQRQLRLPLVVVEVRRVNQLLALFGNRIHNHRMVVAQRIHADAAQQVEVLRTVLVGDVHAFAADKQNRAPVIGRKQKPRFRGANLIQFCQFLSISSRPPSLRCRGLRESCTGREGNRPPPRVKSLRVSRRSIKLRGMRPTSATCRR